MLPIALHLLAGPVTVERTLTLNGIWDTNGKVIVRRTLSEDGSLEWYESSQFSDGDSQTSVISYNSDSSLKRWEFTMISSKEKSVWLAVADGNTIKMSRPFYRNDAMNLTGNDRKTPLEAGDPSKFWWVKSPPPTDYPQKASFFDYGFSNAGDFGDVKLAILPDEAFTLKGKTLSAHVIERTNSYRREKWWLDEMGMPIQRAFFSTGTSTSAYRIEVMR